MCEVSRNLSKYNHPNQPTYPKISKKRRSKSIQQNFLKFCMNNHPTLGQILGKLYGDHVITLAVIAQNIFFTLRKTLNSSMFFGMFTSHDYTESLPMSGFMYEYNMQISPTVCEKSTFLKRMKVETARRSSAPRSSQLSFLNSCD